MGAATKGEELARPMQRAVRNIMWQNCGVVRSGERLEQGLDELADLRNAAAHVDVRPSAEGFGDLALALDLLQEELLVACSRHQAFALRH